MANGHGGRRPGAGRKPKAHRHETAIQAAEEQIKDRLPQLIAKLMQIGLGGYERVEEEWAAAGTQVRGSGEFLTKLFPDLDDDELILIRRRVSIADGDRAALQYLIDRILGKPVQALELTGGDGGPIEIDDTARREADRELAAWRQEMSAKLSSWLSVSPTPPTSATSSESSTTPRG